MLVAFAVQERSIFSFPTSNDYINSIDSIVMSGTTKFNYDFTLLDYDNCLAKKRNVPNFYVEEHKFGTSNSVPWEAWCQILGTFDLISLKLIK